MPKMAAVPRATLSEADRSAKKNKAGMTTQSALESGSVLRESTPTYPLNHFAFLCLGPGSKKLCPIGTRPHVAEEGSRSIVLGLSVAHCD